MQTLTLANTLAQIALLAMQSMSEEDKQKAMSKLMDVVEKICAFGEKFEGVLEKIHNRE